MNGKCGPVGSETRAERGEEESPEACSFRASQLGLRVGLSCLDQPPIDGPVTALARRGQMALGQRALRLPTAIALIDARHSHMLARADGDYTGHN